MNWYFTALRKYAIFSGRASRTEYWYFVLFNLIIYLILAFIAFRLNMLSIAYVYCLAMIIPGIAAGVRRIHDVGKSGWFILVPFYNLILACSPSEIGENEYGPNPFDQEAYGAGDYEKPYDINS